MIAIYLYQKRCRYTYLRTGQQYVLLNFCHRSNLGRIYTSVLQFMLNSLTLYNYGMKVHSISKNKLFHMQLFFVYLERLK